MVYSQAASSEASCPAQVYGNVPNGRSSHDNKQVFAGENVTILCQAGFQPARVDFMTEIVIPEVVGEKSFVVSCQESEFGPRFSDRSQLDGSLCQEQGTCSQLNELGLPVRSKQECRSLVTNAVWTSLYWCQGVPGQPAGPREGQPCAGRPPTFCGANLLCVSKEDPFVCVGGKAGDEGRVCQAPEDRGDFECAHATFRGTVCISCGVDTYQSISATSGSNVCVPCPPNSDTRGKTERFSVSECKCKAGFARQQGSLGEAAPCLPVASP